MKVDVYLIRHGETDWNRETRFQGQTDTRLNSTGEEQAKLLAPIMAHLKPELFLTSDLDRAIRTAEFANSLLNLPIEKHVHLREAHLGAMEGRIRDEVIAALGPDGWARWGAADDLDFGLPGGETKRQVLERSLACLKEFVHQRPVLKKFAVITHGGVVKRLIFNARSAPRTKVSLDNCVIHHLTYTRGLDQWDYVTEISDS
ncbi:MAG: histidine phosphatase family protein [Bdellovibrionia bacterium]